MRKFFKEFKEFISRGNVLDLAVAVIIGGAFSAIVTALTNKIIMPLVNYLLMLIGGKDGLEGAYTFLSKVYTDGSLDMAKSIYIDWGAFIAAIFNFLIIALTLFTIIKTFNYYRKKMAVINSKVLTLTKKEKRAELISMHKEAKERGVSFRTIRREREAAREAEAKRIEEEKQAEEERKKQEEYEMAHESEALLREIRDILRENRK